jgi:hypothetical protein
MPPTLTRAAALAAALALSAPAVASFAPADLFDDQARLSQDELGTARGGMMVNGIAMDFAIVIRSTVENAVSQGLQTVLTINDAGGLGSAVTTAIGADAGTALSTSPDGGMTMTLPAGTTIVHEVLSNQVQSLIANTSNGVSLNHSTQVNVDLPGFTAQSQSWYSSSRALQASMEAALSGLGQR